LFEIASQMQSPALSAAKFEANDQDNDFHGGWSKWNGHQESFISLDAG